MLQLVTKVSVVTVFGVRARRTDRMDCWCPQQWHGTWGCQLDRRLWRVSAACFRLVSNSWTLQDKTTGTITFYLRLVLDRRRFPGKRRRKSVAGRFVVGSNRTWDLRLSLVS